MAELAGDTHMLKSRNSKLQADFRIRGNTILMTLNSLKLFFWSELSCPLLDEEGLGEINGKITS